MSLFITGLRSEKSPEHRAKVDVLRACANAEVPLPEEISDYFQGGTNELAPLQVNVKSIDRDNGHSEVREVRLSDLPDGITSLIIEYWY